MSSESFTVEVAYALPEKQKIIAVTVASGCTALQAVEQSGICHVFADIDLATAKMGVFSHLIAEPHTYVVKAGDRIEIYRPLLIDPKEARAQRAAKAKAKLVGKT